MIFDKLKNAAIYYPMHSGFKKGFEFLIDSDLRALEEGKYDIDSDNIFASVQSLTTKPVKDQKWEVHRRYIDIQYLIYGVERMHYGNLADFDFAHTQYDREKDIQFLDGRVYNAVNLQKGDFVIFYPHDVHAPMLSVVSPQDIKKVIVKVAVDLK